MMKLKIGSVCFALMTLAMNSVGAVEIIAHRGASHDAPENTVAAMRLGYEQGADAGELDIYLTKDEKIVVLHDRDTARVSGVTNRPAETTLAALRQLPAGQWGKWKGSSYSEKIPSLEEALAAVPKDKGIFIEIKCGPEILPELERVLKRSGLKERQIVIIGFGYDTMVEARARFPKLPLYWLVGADKDKKYPPVEDLIAKAKQARFEGLNLEQGFPIDREFVRKVHDAGLKLYTWTVDNDEVARRFAAAGVDGITTNRPKWLREQLEKAASATGQ